MPGKLTQGPRIGYDLARVGAGLSRGPNRKKTLVAAAWSNTWPAPGATLDLDFANDRGFVRGVGQGGAMDAVTFTRASNGTFVNEQGLLVGASVNKLSSTVVVGPNWSNGSGISLSLNQAIAPDGTLSATAAYEVSGFNSRVIGTPPFTFANGPETLSVYAKANGRDWLVFEMVNTAGTLRYVWFNLSTGTIGTVQSGLTASMQDAGNGWFRCAASIVSPNYSNTRLYLFSVPADGVINTLSFNGDPTKGIFLWGPQVEAGSTATPYYPTNIGQPRFDWASTAALNGNLISYSQEFDNAVWNKTALLAFGSGSVANTTATLDPIGTNTADFIVPNTSNSTHVFEWFIQRQITQNTYTVSIYAKAGGYDYIFMQPASGQWGCTFNLSNGTLGSFTFGALVSSVITDVGNGWYRCSITGVLPTENNYVGCRVWVSNTDSINSYAGNGTSGVYFWGAQFEIGSSPTAYKATGAFTPTNTPLTPAPTCNGLLIEESRTNRLLWCRDATQSNWTKTNVTAAKDQTGIDGVANAASSLTATSANGTCIQTITLASGSRTSSVYLKRITGTGNVQVSLDGTTWSTVELSDTEWRRIVLSGTVMNPVVGIRIATSGDAVAMDYGQVEDGLFVTTPILTTAATATRSADVATVTADKYMPMSQGNYSGNTAGTLYCEVLKTSDYVNDAPVSIGGVYFGKVNTLYYAYMNPAVGGFGAFFASVATPIKLCFSWNSHNTQRFSVNGQKAAIRNLASTYIYGNMSISPSGFGTTAAACIKQIKFFPKAVSETAVEEMSK